MTFHLGILGGGNISNTHARAAAEIDGAKIVAFCGQNREKVKQLAETFDAAAYENLDRFLNHQPMDVVLIGSPSGLHAEQGIAAAGRGLHLLIEKPIAITTEQTDALIAACEKAKVKLGVFFQDRVATDIVKLKEWIDAGKFGKLFLSTAQVKWFRPPEYYGDSHWRGTWAMDGGGALMNQGIHSVDLLLWLMGAVSEVSARAITAIHDIEVEDTVVATLQFANGAIGTLEATTAAYPGFARRLEITGSQGTVILENQGIRSANLRTPIAELMRENNSAEDERSTSPTISNTRGHRMIIEDFLRAIATNGMPLCDGRQARRSVELIEAIYQSSRTGQPVKLTADE
ncbi:MAG: Gfo/Idh/MocA family oxidoreductase [Acidobacteriota bacterium]